MTDAAVVVVGGTLSALVTADALAREGRPVLLLLPARGVGGGFMPVEREGRRLERGMRVLELHYEGLGEPPPIEDYRPGDHGHRPWTRLVRDWVGELVGEDALVEIDPPAMAVNGRVGPEVLLRTDLEPIRELLDAASWTPSRGRRRRPSRAWGPRASSTARTTPSSGARPSRTRR